MLGVHAVSFPFGRVLNATLVGFYIFEKTRMKIWYRILMIVLVCTSVNGLYAAPAPPGGSTTGGPGACFPDPCVPIDQGEYFILLGGGLFAIYFLFRKKNKPVN